jgi:hypothetical protein
MSSLLQGFIWGVMFVLALAGTVYGWLQKKLGKEKEDEHAKALIESAHKLAKAESDSKSLDELMSDRAKRFGSADGSEDKKE